MPQYEQRQVRRFTGVQRRARESVHVRSGSRSGEESVRAESAYALSDSANARMTEPESARSSTRAIGSPCVATGAKTNRGPSGSADSGTSSWSLSA